MKPNRSITRREVVVCGLAGGAAGILSTAIGSISTGLLTTLSSSVAKAAVVTPRAIPTYTLSLDDFGGSPYASVFTNINAFNSAFSALKANGGGTLVIPPGTYQLGSYGSNTSAINVDGLSNVLISGYGATLSITTTATAVPAILHFQNPNNITVAGLSYYDPGTDVSINWRGAVCMQVDCTVTCDAFKVVDCVANHCLTLFKAYGGGGSLNYLLTGLDIQGTCTDCYYGINVNNTGRYSKVNIKTTRVRRAYICYGARNWDIFIDATVDGPQGSNALCELPTSVAGPIVSDLNISMKVSGNLAWHSGLVTFFHQEDPSMMMSIENINADIQVSNATSLPGNGMFYFLYWDGTQLLSSTNKIWKNIKCTGSLDAVSTALFAGKNKIVSVGAVSTSAGNSVFISSYFQNLQSLSGLPSYFSWFTPSSPSPSPSPAPSPAIGTPLNMAGVSPESGFAYIIMQDFGTPADASGYYIRSTLQIYENGVALGPAHAAHADIRTYGKGRFSHWDSGSGQALYFSTSDNTDPRTNGRAYSYTTDSTSTSPAPMDSTAPSVAITNPINGAVVKRGSQIQISASASDNVGVKKVEFYVNGKLIGTVQSPPYAQNLRVSRHRGVKYNLQAKAYDANGNVGASPIVSIITS